MKNYMALIFKDKGYKKERENYRGIKFISDSMSICEKII